MTAYAQQNISFAEFELDRNRRRLLRGGEPVVLYAKAFALLSFLVEKNGQIVTKDEILDAVWPGQFVEEANLSVQISALRKALGEKRDAPRFLITVPGKGYKFVADISNGNGSIAAESQGSSDNSGNDRTLGEILPDAASVGIARRRSAIMPIVLSLAGLFLLGVVAWAYWYMSEGGSASRFENIRVTRLTNSGNIRAASVSADGNFIAYVTGEADGNSLWLRQVGTGNDVRVLPPTQAEFWGLTFSPDGAHIYYNLFAGDKADVELFRVPLLGGVSEKIPAVVASAVTFAPDGRRITYIQPDSAANMNYLIVADADGGNGRVVAKKQHPNTFVFGGRSAAWSPDGKVIACTVNFLEADANYSSLVVFDPEIGTEMPLGESRWYGIFRVEWLKDGSGLLISAAKEPSDNSQVWLVSYPGGEARQVTQDLNNYGSLGASANGSFIAIQTNSVNSVSVGEVDGVNTEFIKIAEETGELQPLVWTADGRIVFRSSQGGRSNLWTMDALGANRRQLTTNAQADTRGMCASHDGRYFVYTSVRSGKSNLWRVNADGSNEVQLTHGDTDAYPQCLPDDQTVIFQRGIYSKPLLWKISLSGGDPVQLTNFHAKWPEISDDGNRVAYFHMMDDAWRIGVMSTDGRTPLPSLNVPPNLKENTIHWSPDNKLIYYIGASGSVGNIWTLSASDSTYKPFTKFTSQLLSDFSFSTDGKRIAVTQTSSFSDVIMIESAGR